MATATNDPQTSMSVGVPLGRLVLNTTVGDEALDTSIMWRMPVSPTDKDDIPIEKQKNKPVSLSAICKSNHRNVALHIHVHVYNPCRPLATTFLSNNY